MSPEQNPQPAQAGDKVKQNALLKIVLLVVAVLAVIAATAFLILRDNKVTDAPAPIEPTAGVTLSLEPAQKTLKKDEPFTMELWLDTDGQDINAVKAIISYPQEAFEITGIDDEDSAFSLAAEGAGADGQIRISRGEANNVNGRHLVAKINAVPRLDSGTAAFTFTDDSVAVRASDNSDVLSQKLEASYTLEASE